MNLRLSLLFASFCLAGVAAPAQNADSTPDHPAAIQTDTVAPALTADGLPSCTRHYLPQQSPEGVHQVAASVVPPAPTYTPDPTFYDEQRKYARALMKKQHIKKFQTISVIGLTVDTNGNPKNVCVANEVGHGFDRKAFEAVEQYRFKPATRDGKPVAVYLAVQVKFELW